MEIENLTPAEKVSVQDNIAGLHSHTLATFAQPGQQSGSILDPTSGTGTINELSSLISIRLRHQSEEEASAVRVACTRSSQDDESVSFTHHPHNPKALASHNSEQWQLFKKINEVIKASGNSAGSTQGESTGLNRRNRWTTEKVAAGSSVYATSGCTTSGNVANAQAAARKSAQSIVKQRASAFASLNNAESLASAKINVLVSLTNGSFGIAVINDQLMMVEVLTMYEKSGAKGAKHSWISSTTSIGAISYLAGMIRRSTSNHFLELLPGPFEAILQGLIANKQAVFGAVKGLLQPSRKSRRSGRKVYPWTTTLGDVGPKSTPGTPISVIFGQPLGPKIGQNPYPTLCGIIRGPGAGNRDGIDGKDYVGSPEEQETRRATAMPLPVHNYVAACARGADHGSFQCAPTT
ncbi:hypothetical protein V8E53_014444 [Lactarius tabidus]